MNRKNTEQQEYKYQVLYCPMKAWVATCLIFLEVIVNHGIKNNIKKLSNPSLKISTNLLT